MPRFGRFRAIANLSVLTLLFACGGGDGMTGPDTPVVTVTFSAGALAIAAGDTASVKATASDGSSASFTSSNTGVATVTSSGLVTGLSAGSATITARAGGAEATLAVTVEALTPAVSIVSLTQNGVPVDPGDVTGTIDVTLEATTGNTFEGRMVVTLDGAEVGSVEFNAGAPSAPAGSADAVEAAAGGRVTTRTTPISVTAIDATSLEAIGHNGTQDLVAQLQRVPGVQVGQASPPRSVNVNNVPQTVVNIRGVRQASDGQGNAWQAGDLLVDGRLVRWDPNDARVPLSATLDIQSVQVLRGPQAATWGGNAVAGVVSITTKSGSEDWSDLGTANMAGTWEAKQARWQMSDGSTIVTPIYNAYAGRPAGIPSSEFRYDSFAPAFASGATTWTDPNFNGWLGKGVDLSAWAQLHLASWGAGGDITDAGIGGTVCTPRAGADVNSLVAVSTSDDLPASATRDQLFALYCGDAAQNYRIITYGAPVGLDATAPTVTVTTGAGYLSGYTVNPAATDVFDVIGSDVGSGFDAYHPLVSLQRFTPQGSTCVWGADDGNGGCTMTQITLTDPGRVTGLDFSAGLFDFKSRWPDNSGNLTATVGARYIDDTTSPVVANLALPGSYVAGQDATFGFDLSDDIGLRRWSAAAEYGSTYLGGVTDVVDYSSNQLIGQLSAQWTTKWTASIEWTAANRAPSHTILGATGFRVAVKDRAWAFGDQRQDIPAGASTGGRTTSFAQNGQDWFDWVSYGGIEICNPKKGACTTTPTTLSFQLESRVPAGGSSDVVGYQLLAALPWPADPNIDYLVPITSVVGTTMQDNGSWYQLFGSPTIDLNDMAVSRILHGGTYDIYAAALDKDNNYLISRTPRTLTVKLSF